MPVTNKNAFRQARRAEIESGTRASLTPNEAKKAFANATRRTAGEAALGAGLAVAAPVAVLAATGGGAGGAVTRGVAGEGQRAAGRLAAQRAQRQVLKKAAQRGAHQAAKKTGVEAAKKQYVRKLLNRAARGNHTLTTTMINKAVQRAGGDPRVAYALEKGGQAARNLLQALA